MTTDFDDFSASINTSHVVEDLRGGLIGKNAMIDGPCGPKKLVYADYVASGRALRQIEDFVQERLLPYYANSHTEASFVGGRMTRLRREARDVIRRLCHADERHAVVFTGSGATQGINRLVHLFGLDRKGGPRPCVIIGPYEHHSNILPWRECGAEVVELPEAECGGPCPDALAAALKNAEGRPIVGAFSAASNVTGVLTDIAAVTRQLKAAGALAIWDFAGGGPYLPIDMCPAPDAEIDAIVLSPHKFIGGPQASGLLLLRKGAVVNNRPTFPGGGTVRFVSPSGHDYTQSVEAREEAGTPNVIGDLRAALCFLVKDAIGQDFIIRRNAEVSARAIDILAADDRIELLGRLDCPRLPILSFRIRDGQGGFVHQQLVTRMLSDRYGIQARGGCACAGPYVHRLLGIDDHASEAMRAAILSGQELEKPGFVRLNLSYLASDEEVAYILDSVLELAQQATAEVSTYRADPATAVFEPLAS